MAWGFLVPVAISLLVAYVLTNSADEIAYLAAAILVVSLFLSLILAPWPVQLLLLGLVLFSNRRISQPKRQHVAEESDDKKVKLSYRGIDYEPNSLAVEVTEDEIIGKYRGQVCKCPKVKDTTALEPVSGLKYRGASVKLEESVTPALKEPAVLSG